MVVWHLGIGEVPRPPPRKAAPMSNTTDVIDETAHTGNMRSGDRYDILPERDSTESSIIPASVNSKDQDQDQDQDPLDSNVDANVIPSQSAISVIGRSGHHAQPYAKA